MRTREQIIANINELHCLERNVNNPIPAEYAGKFADAPSVWIANTRLATELELVDAPHLLQNKKQAELYLANI
tara:strand:+ start:1363 stop:1581 length:219 start_codon:yes stop_codon:yes gene_type:complete